MTLMRAAILSIGDELILGQAVDRHAAWLSARLSALGVMPDEHRTVSDDRDRIAAAMRELASTHDVLVVTGGLGPTDDDVTRIALGDVLTPGTGLVVDADAERRLRAWFRRGGHAFPESNRRQAERPATARCLDNPNGTAPGLAGEHAGCRIWALPGPGREMQPMFDAVVVPALRGHAVPIATASVHAYGIGEASAAERLGSLTARDHDPLVGTTASDGVITARIRSDRGDADAVARVADQVAAAWAPYAFGRGATTLAGAVIESLAASGSTLAVAESCTGGWLGKTLVDEPGASRVFLGGWLTYANAMKTSQLGVPAELLDRHGAVSHPVAAAMAEGARRAAGSDYALSITGVAGPDGGTPAKPVGTVFIGLARPRGAPLVRRFRFRADRSFVRRRSVHAALDLVWLEHRGAPEDLPLLWEEREVTS